MENNNIAKTTKTAENTTAVVPATAQATVTIVVPQEAMLPANFYASLSPEKKAEVDNITAMIDIRDVSFVSTFGSEYKSGIDKFSTQLLDGKSTLELGDAGTLLDSAVKIISDFDDSDWDSVKEEPGILGKLFSASTKMTKKRMEKAVKRIQTQYKDVNGKIQAVANQLIEKQTAVMKIYDDFTNIYVSNKEIYENLTILVCAAQMALEKADEEMERLKNDPTVDPFVLREYQSAYSRFNKKVTNLVATRYLLFSFFPKVQIIQETALSVHDAIQDVIESAIPMWKSEMAVAVGIEVVTAGATSVNAANEFTNRMFVAVSEASREMVLQAAQASSTGIIDVETVRTLNNNLLETLRLKNQARSEGDKKLRSESLEITKLQGDLIQQLQTLE